MNDLERERDFYRRQCNELGARLLLLQREQAQARQEARFSRTTARLIREVYRLAEARMSLAEIGRRFLHTLQDTLKVDRLALLRYQPDSGSFVTEHRLGFPQAGPLSFSPPHLPEEFYFVNSASPAEPLADCLRQAAGVPYLVWVFDVQSGLALLLGNIIEDQHLHPPFEIGFREILEGSLRVFIDVTVRQRTETDLSKFKLGIERSTDAFFLTDINGAITYVNSAFEEIYGFSQAEAVGKTPRILKSGLIPLAGYQHFWETLLAGGSVAGEIVNKAKDGRLVHIAGTNNPILDEAGNIIGFLAIHRDITAQKQAEAERERLLSEVQRLAGIVRNHPDFIGIGSMAGETFYVNPAGLKLLGLPPDYDVTRLDFKELIPSSKIDQFLQEARTVQPAAGSRSWSGEGYLLRADGSQLLVERTVVVNYDADHKPVSLSVTMRDITARKQAEESLRASERRNKTLLEAIPDLIIRFSRDGVYLDVKEARDIPSIIPLEEIIGRNMADLLPPEVVERQMRHIEQALDTGETQVYEQKFVNAGQEKYEEVRVAPGGANEVLMLFRDITERKQAEAALAYEQQLLQALLDNSPDYLFFKDRQSRFIRINRAHAQDLLNLKSPEQAIGLTDFDLFPAADAQRFYDEEQRIMESREPVLARELCIPSPTHDGEMVWVSEHKVPLVNQAGEVFGLFGISRDITERKRIEEAVAKRAAELETVAQVSTAAATILDADRLLQEVVDLTRERFALYHAHIYLLQAPSPVSSLEGGGEGGVLVLAAGAGEVGRHMVAEGWRIPLVREQSLVARAARSRQGVIVNDVQAESGFLPNPLLPETRSELAVPLLVGDRVLGVLDVQADEVGRFSEEDVRIQTILAAQIAVALENAGQYQRTQTALAEIQQSQALLRSIIDATPDWIFIKDQEHRYRLVNQGYANDLHLKPEDFIGKNDLELGFPEELVKGNPEKGIRGFWSDDRLVMDSGETHVYPNDPAAIDGEVHIFHTIKTPLRDAAGHIWGVLAFARDITEREKLLAEMEQSQELLRSVIDATPDWIVVKDREHRFRLVNQGFANSMHLTPADIIGKNDIDLGMPEEIVKGNPEKGIRGFWADDLEVMDGGQMKIIESEPTVIDGQPAFLNTIKVPMRDARGEVWGVLAYVRNITSLKQAEEAMAKRAAELACLNDISRELESSPPLPELLPWVAGRIPAAMQYPHLCAAVIEYAGQLYGDAAALKLSTQMTHGLYVSGEIVGRIYIAYTQKHDFLNEESALLGGIANRLSGYIENRRLFEQTQTRAEREQILREVTNRIRGSVDVQTIMRTAVQEVGQVLGRPAFVYLGNGGNGEQSLTGPGEKEA